MDARNKAKRARRTFLVGGASLGAAWTLFGCSGSGGSDSPGVGPGGGAGGSSGGQSGFGGGGFSEEGAGGAGTGGAGTGGAGTGGAGTGDAGTGGSGGAIQPTVCDLTEDNLKGPFHSVGSPERRSFWDDDPEAARLLISGQVLGTDCQPIAGAYMDFWEARPDGLYDNEGFRFRGHQYANARGEYELRCIHPGRYLNAGQYRPEHIHATVTAPGYKSLTTQLYLEGDPFNDVDTLIRESLIMAVRKDANGVTLAEFHFVLEPS